MIKVPSYRYFSEHQVTCFQDDAEFWKFYLIPDYVTLRYDDGIPKFLLVKYAFSDEDRVADPDLPMGGGYLAFDTELRLEPEAVEAIKVELQRDVDQHWHALKSAAEADDAAAQRYLFGPWSYLGATDADLKLGLAADPLTAPPGDHPPAVIIDAPTFSEGTFTVMAPQAASLVTDSIASGPVSLLGANVASANMDLSSAGATFMEKTLVDPDGSGGAELAPIQVLYQLKMWARLPPTKVFVSADIRSLYSSIRSYYHDFTDYHCSPDSFSTYDYQSEMAIQSGLITVKIEPGAPLPDDMVRQLQQDAQKIVTDLLKDRFFNQKEEDDDTAEEERDKELNDWIDRDADIYYVKSESEISFSSFEYVMEIGNVREWPINPQGIMQTFLADLPPEEVRKYVRSVDLTDSFYQSLNLTVSAFANWSDPLAFVECEVRYAGRDEAGEEVEKFKTFTFTKDHTTEVWDPSLIGTARKYEYRWRVCFVGREAEPWQDDWATDTTPMLNLAVGRPGLVQVQVVPGNLDFGAITNSVQIEMEYAAPGVPVKATTLALSNGVGEQRFEYWTFVPRSEPVRYRLRYFLKNGQDILEGWEWCDAERLFINEPRSPRRLDVQLVPTGKWSGVQQAIVSLRYLDSVTGDQAEGTFRLTSADEFRSWVAFLADPKRRKFQHRMIVSFKDGTSTDTGWVDADGDQALPLKVKELPKLEVELLPNLVDFTVTPVVEASLHYTDPRAGINEVESFALTGPGPQKWTVDLTATSPREFKYQLAYHTNDGRVINRKEVLGTDEKVVVPRLEVPELAVVVMPKLVNFAETPLVEVTIDYRDDQLGVEETDTLVFEGPGEQRFRLEVPEGASETYQLTVTYYLADGSSVQRDPATLDQKKVVIPRYVRK